VNVLLIYPRCPDTFWGFKYALRFISRKAVQPPLGLVTVAAMLPKAWNLRLVDMNVTALKDADLEWAELALISAMTVQKASARQVIQKCIEHGVRTVAGGPLFTASPEDFPEVDHLVLNEAEITLPPFLKDLSNACPRKVYTTADFSEVTKTPVPMWELLDMKAYAAMNIQYSRGCPFDCEFCDITALYGPKVRTKDANQLLTELSTLHSLGWRGEVFFVDDNFIGNQGKLKRDILPALIQWTKMRGYVFSFQTEASINLADDDELMKMMVLAGFDTVFVGIETPNEESLLECNKVQNRNKDLLGCVRKIQESGLQVTAGFILGFDSDPPSVFEKLTAFIQNSGIATAMVGLLNAPRKTKLYQRLAREGRILSDGTGDNTDFTTNFVPKMSREKLIAGYVRVIKNVYSVGPYYHRVREFLRRYRPLRKGKGRLPRLGDVVPMVKSMFRLGVAGKERFHYWKLFFWTIFRRPRLFRVAMTLAVYGFHYRRFFESHLD